MTRKSVYAALFVPVICLACSCSNSLSEASITSQTTAEPVSHTDETVDWSDWTREEYENAAEATHYISYTTEKLGYVTVYETPAYNSKDNPEYFDTENYTTMELMPNAVLYRKVVNVGDAVDGFVCTSAETEYTKFIYSDETTQTTLGASRLHLEGEAAVTGYVMRMSGDEAYMEKDELLFYPDNTEGNRLPVRANEKADIYDLNGDLIYTASYMSLGVASDYESIDFSQIEPGEAYHVEVTVTSMDLNYKTYEMGFAITTAVISSLEKV